MKNYLSSNCCQDEGQVIKEEPLERSDEYCIRYGNWLKTNRYQKMLHTLYQVFEWQSSKSSEKDNNIHFVNIPSLNGFTMSFNPERWEQDDFKFLFEYLAMEFMQQYKYRKLLSKTEYIRFPNRTEIVERYTLNGNHEEAIYSCILLRLCYINGKISTLKFCANCADKNAQSFQNILQRIIPSS